MTRTHDKTFVIAVAAAAAGITALLFLVFQDDGSGRTTLPSSSSTNDIEEIRTELASLRESVRDLERKTSVAEAGLSRSRAPVASSDLERLVREILEEQGIAIDTTRQDVEGPDGHEAELSGILQDLQTPLPAARREELWERIRRLGAADRALEYFKQLAEANPGSPDAQTDLGMAYIQKMLAVDDDAERAELGAKVDESFDRALELDPDHWEARYRKAMGLTYAPALSGRQNEAIGHFERLVEQQRGMTASPEQVDTYLYLGRLYEQRGMLDRAAQVWREGLSRHPNNQELTKLARQLANSGR